MSTPRVPRRAVKITVAVLIAVLVIWLGSMLGLAGSLWSRVRRLQQMASEPSRIDLPAVAAEIHGADREYTLLHAGLSPLLWIGSLFGGDMGAAKPMADAGAELLAAGDESIHALTSSLGTFQISSLSAEKLPEILSALASASPQLQGARTYVDRAADDLGQIKGPLSPRLDSWSSRLSQAVRLAQQGLTGAQIAPALLGQDGPRSYLLLLENSDELRATGGFISAVGVVKVDQGKLVDIFVQDSFALEDFTLYHPDPPQPLMDYMRAEQWAVRDANWSPDFPASAQDAIRLYNISQPGQVDGVIALTAQGVKLLIASLSPLQVDGLPEPVTPANFDKVMAAAWNPPPDATSPQEMRTWLKTRKQALGLVMTAAVDKILHGQPDWPELIQGTLNALDQRQLMLYTASEAGQLKQAQWDGSIRPDPGDYLMVVDSNVGFNKANMLIDETINYQVTLQPDGTAQAAVQADYAHRGKRTGVTCVQYTNYGTNITYAQLQQRCYYDYLRVLVPFGARLLQSDPLPASPDYLLPGVPSSGLAEITQDELFHRAVLDQFFVVEYGQTLHAQYKYALPEVVKDVAGQKQYSLLIQKQPGTNALPLTVELALPPGARLVSADPLPSTVSGSSLSFKMKLDLDRQIQVIYRLTP